VAFLFFFWIKNLCTMFPVTKSQETKMEYPKTRAKAKAVGAKYYFTGEPCKHGHIALRKTKGVCVECLKVEWKQAAEKRADYFVQYNKKEDVKERKHAWYTKNKDQVIQTAATRPAEVLRAYRTAWKQNNLVQVRADTKARRRKHRQATPSWLTRQQKSEIRQLYQIAITMTKTTGEQYVVDHIVPLRSEEVCGLHVPWNLRVMTQEENLKKSNKLLDTPHKQE
jgi:5-methylcytosine-specific restriction endonuclease McrA